MLIVFGIVGVSRLIGQSLSEHKVSHVTNIKVNGTISAVDTHSSLLLSKLIKHFSNSYGIVNTDPTLKNYIKYLLTHTYPGRILKYNSLFHIAMVKHLCK